MKLHFHLFSVFLFVATLYPKGNAQTNPIITSWLQNTTKTGTYYVSGNSTKISNGILVNCQLVRYSANWVYVSTTGVPSYPVGPFNGDGNPNQAGDQKVIYKLPLNPAENKGTKTSLGFNTMAIFINGVSMFDYRDGVSWNISTNSFCGGPGRTACPGGPNTTQAWNRDAIVYERLGFDCSKGHPAGINYHHHQNPSAFKLDLKVISTICNLYASDGLYTIDATKHSPLIGYALDGFPIYGAYGYANADGTGGIKRIKSGYQLRNITVRTHHANGTDVSDGPPVSTTYPLGSFAEDYEWVAHPTDPSYLDIHNGRFCVTPEYPKGIYCYFTTVDANHNSAFPYVIGPSFYGVKSGSTVTSVTETTTTYKSTTTSVTDNELKKLSIEVFPNPSQDLIAIQVNGLVPSDLQVTLLDANGRKIYQTEISKGQTIAYFDIQTLYSGLYYVTISSSNGAVETRKLMITK
jgi:hypothetical protein